MGEPNSVDAPYPVPTTTFGWAAGDAAYAMGSYDLDDDQALVLRGRSPQCAFWNMCLWNPFLHTYNYDYERVTINGAQVRYEEDGSWVIVIVAHAIRAIRTGSRPPGHQTGPDLVPLVPARAHAGRPDARGGVRVERHPMSRNPADPPSSSTTWPQPRFTDEARAILDMMAEAGAIRVPRTRRH